MRAERVLEIGLAMVQTRERGNKGVIMDGWMIGMSRIRGGL